MNEIKIFKDEKFRETSQAEEFQKFGELCYLLAGAVCAENKEDAWKLIHDAAKIGAAADSTAFPSYSRRDFLVAKPRARARPVIV